MEEIEIVEETKPDQSWKIKAIVIGGLLGALTGVGAAFLLTSSAEKNGTKLSFTPGKGMQLGMLITGLLRSIMSLGEK